MAVEIEWIDSISAAATGNKIYRDTVPPTGKVEVADIANGNQIYQDDTAEVGTGVEYKYSIQAHDGAGDETTQEVQGDNMDFITTAGTSITNYVFDGSANSYLMDEAVTPTMLDGIVSQSWVIRVKRTANDVQHGILGCENETLAIKLEVDAGDNKADVVLSDAANGGVSFTGGTVSTDGAWYIYFFQYNTTTKLLSLYENTNLISSETDLDDYFTARTAGRIFAFGAAVIGGGTPGRLVGEASDLQFYNRELTSTEISNLVTDLTDLPADSATSLVANFAGQKTETEWTSEIGGYVLTNQGGVTTE